MWNKLNGVIGEKYDICVIDVVSDNDAIGNNNAIGNNDAIDFNDTIVANGAIVTIAMFDYLA